MSTALKPKNGGPEGRRRPAGKGLASSVVHMISESVELLWFI